MGRQTAIATLVSTDQFWVQASVPLALLDRLQFPDRMGGKGSAAQIVLDKGYGGKPTQREGTLFKLLPDIDPKSRMARVLVEVENPFNHDDEKQENQGGKILLGSYVKVRINAGELKNVYVIPRAALREDNKLWLITEEGQLDIRQITVLWRRIDDVLVTGEEAIEIPIVTNRLVSPVSGMRIRTNRGRE